MRHYLHVDMDAGTCRLLPLPPELSSCGGRALASLLAAQKPGRLCLAPGLLTGCRCASAGRCAVSCTNGDGSVGHSNAGGSVGPAMASSGLAALVIDGVQGRQERVLHDLVVAQGGAFLRPASAQGQGISSAMETLSRAFPGAAAVATAGPAAECGLPMASLAFSDHRFRASSHAGSGSGALLCRAGLHSIVFLKGEAPASESPELAEASMRFMRELKGVRSEIPASSGGCTSSCVLACHKGDGAPSPEKKGGKSGWPCFHELWSSGNADADAVRVRRFMELCNELGADAFVLGQLMADTAGQGLLVRGDADAALAELEKLARPGESVLFSPAMAWKGSPKKARGGEEGVQGIIMDCLGICRFAADAMVRVPAVREAVLEMVRCLHGLGADDLFAMASAVLQVETGGHVAGRGE